ncbi:MAG TPA: isoprenylcysteine carboxylmethyltransferase family protein [Longimicrobiales bacterium]|nr:isoprenylcysteine carboxylmethyltransferase family protein [Longimicrobiales bacterium]
MSAATLLDMDRIRYTLAVLLVATIPPAVIWWYLVHPFVGFWRRLGPRWTLAIVGVSMVSLMVALGSARRSLVGADLGTNWVLAGLGLVCFGIAAGMGLKRKRHLTTRILAGVPELDEDEPGILLTEGPYAVIRHPRYVEVLVGVLGYAMVANHVGGYVVALLVVPALHLVVLLEERELTDRFGAAYEAYRARVPRYLPRRGSPPT